MAIKVNGTTVINDSRALTNISSIDTTTKNAIAAAGVGGAMTLLTDSSFGQVAGVYQSFTAGYSRFLIQITNAYVFGSVSQFGGKFQFTDSSGSLITSNTYLTQWGENSKDDNQIAMYASAPWGGTHSMYTNMDIIVTEPLSSTVPTMMTCSLGQRSIETNQYYSGYTSQVFGFRKAGSSPNWAEVNNSIYITNNGSGDNFSKGHIRTWGIK